MHRGLFITGLMAMLLAGAPAHAQSPPLLIRPNPGIKLKVKPPSAAVNQALKQVPGAKVLGVKLLPDNNYSITLRKGSAVRRLIVPSSP